MPLVEVDSHNGMAVLALNRPPVNAVTPELAIEVGVALDELESGGRAQPFIFTGRNKAFSAGLDLREIPALSPAGQKALIATANEIAARLYTWPAPVVGAINGHALAAGFVLALAPDYRIGVEGDVKFGVTEVKVGIPFPAVPLEIMCAELEPSVTRMLTMTGKIIGPEQALAAGVVDELVQPDRLLDRAAEVLKELSSFPADSYARIKKQLRRVAFARIHDILEKGNDPMLDTWLDEQTAGASADVLRDARAL